MRASSEPTPANTLRSSRKQSSNINIYTLSFMEHTSWAQSGTLYYRVERTQRLSREFFEGKPHFVFCPLFTSLIKQYSPPLEYLWSADYSILRPSANRQALINEMFYGIDSFLVILQLRFVINLFFVLQLSVPSQYDPIPHIERPRQNIPFS